MPETIHCSICKKPIRVKDFPDQMNKLRHHYKLAHHKQFRAWVKKSVATKKKNKSKRKSKR